ncbi:hypothetical protein D3C87_1570210 [compost metagenome]
MGKLLFVQSESMVVGAEAWGVSDCVGFAAIEENRLRYQRLRGAFGVNQQLSYLGLFAAGGLGEIPHRGGRHARLEQDVADLLNAHLLRPDFDFGA